MREIEIEVEPDLKYSEDVSRVRKSLPVRDCFIWTNDVAEPISGLNLFSFEQRFGSQSVACEGIGGVETLPDHRCQGLMKRVLELALQGASSRVPVVFVSDAVEGLYEKYGFVTCAPEGALHIHVRDVDRWETNSRHAQEDRLRKFTGEDLPAMVRLYNREHAFRPWTHRRHPQWNRLQETGTWIPGSEVIILQGSKGIDGYAVTSEGQFGHVRSSFVVDELAAKNLDAARALLVEISRRCWKQRISHFQVLEPLDGLAGMVAQEIGCEYRKKIPPSGGQMGRILNRKSLLAQLEPELKRRLGVKEFDTRQKSSWNGLCSGDILADDRVLLKLLVGYHSLDEAISFGTYMPDAYREIGEAWFPGHVFGLLPMPYSHKLDRY